MDKPITKAVKPKAKSKPKAASAKTYSNLSGGDASRLLSATYADTPEFGISDLKGWAKVLKVYDGDTIHIALIFKGDVYKLTCRILGIDTAELKTKNVKEKEHAVKARDRVISLTKDGLMWAHVMSSNDKYGRYLTKIYTDSTEAQSVSDILIAEGLAYAYDGKTKKKFEEWYEAAE